MNTEVFELVNKKKISHLKKASMLKGESNSFELSEGCGSPSSSEKEIVELSASMMLSERNPSSISKKVNRQQFSSRINFTNIN